MCNLYSMTKSQKAIRDLAKALRDGTGNLPPLRGIFPDYPAPIVRNAVDGRELAMARWGMPTPPQFLDGRKSDPGVTNVRNTNSSHWRRWLGPESRCLVPFTSFAEPDNGTYGGRAPVWFALDEDRPLAFTGCPQGPRVRGSNPLTPTNQIKLFFRRLRDSAFDECAALPYAVPLSLNSCCGVEA